MSASNSGIKRVIVTSSSGKGGRRHEWWADMPDPEDFAMALGLFITDYERSKETP